MRAAPAGSAIGDRHRPAGRRSAPRHRHLVIRSRLSSRRSDDSTRSATASDFTSATLVAVSRVGSTDPPKTSEPKTARCSGDWRGRAAGGRLVLLRRGRRDRGPRRRTNRRRRAPRPRSTTVRAATRTTRRRLVGRHRGGVHVEARQVVMGAGPHQLVDEQGLKAASNRSGAKRPRGPRRAASSRLLPSNVADRGDQSVDGLVIEEHAGHSVHHRVANAADCRRRSPARPRPGPRPARSRSPRRPGRAAPAHAEHERLESRRPTRPSSSVNGPAMAATSSASDRRRPP